MKLKAIMAGLLLILPCVVSSCASAPSQDANTAKDASAETSQASSDGTVSTKQDSAVSGYQVEVNDCADRACSMSSECCNGYSCGFDPERSRVQRYCMPGS